MRASELLGCSLLLACSAAPRSALNPASDDEALALVGGTIYVSPTEAPIRNGILLIRHGRIAAVGTRASLRLPSNTRSIDCSGRTITAGFWNSHVHFLERKWQKAESIPAPELDRQLEQTLSRYGFTSVFDLSSDWENTQRLRTRIESGEVRGPGIRSTGQGLIPPGGVPSDAVLSVMGFAPIPLPEIEQAEQALTLAKQRLDQGADGIKLFLSSTSQTALPEGAIQAVVDEAHRRGKPVFAHPNNAADVLAAAMQGVDVIVHTTPRSGPWGDSVLNAMKAAEVALTPTLTLWKQTMRHDRASVQEQFVKTAVGQLRTWNESGGRILFGTDLGAVDPDPSTEYALMAEAGMSFLEILASLTTTPAGCFAEAGVLGRIAPGLRADLVVLREDPSRDVRALSDVQYTLRSGEVIYHASE